MFKTVLKYLAGAACGVVAVAVSPLAPDHAVSLTNACAAAFGAAGVAAGTLIGPRVLEALKLRPPKN